MKQFQEQGILEYRIWDATVLVHSVVESINESHKKIVQYAKEKGLPMVCIMEDDILFTAPDAWQYFLNNMPESFDLYLGCTYVMPVELKKVTGFHLYTISEGFYDRFLSCFYI
jgi:DNA polymerase III alpha subunit